MVCLWAGSQIIPLHNIYVAITLPVTERNYNLCCSWHILCLRIIVIAIACVMVEESSVARIMFCITSLLLFLLASCQPFSILYRKQRSFNHEVITFASFGRNPCLEASGEDSKLFSLERHCHLISFLTGFKGPFLFAWCLWAVPRLLLTA